MTGRREKQARFLADAGWSAADTRPLAGDASARRYERLSLGERRAILMDAPSERGESTERFARMARWLSARGYSAPGIIAEDHARGFLLLEDLGDDLFARLIARDPSRETALYAAAGEFLTDLGRHTPPDFVCPLDAPALANLVILTPQWYLPGIGALPNAEADSLPSIIGDLYTRLAGPELVTSLRDFHAENLIWLPERKGTARVGLLDFQDAVAAHPAYDLVSLLQDARREVSPEIEQAVIAQHLRVSGTEPERFLPVYALLGAQRALRILGIFARLTLHFGKAHYLDYIPRVWAHLERNLEHPALTPLNVAVRTGLPAPTTGRLQRMKDQCGQYPMP